jgi:hypothetical protein
MCPTIQILSPPLSCPLPPSAPLLSAYKTRPSFLSFSSNTTTISAKVKKSARAYDVLSCAPKNFHITELMSLLAHCSKKSEEWIMRAPRHRSALQYPHFQIRLKINLCPPACLARLSLLLTTTYINTSSFPYSSVSY